MDAPLNKRDWDGFSPQSWSKQSAQAGYYPHTDWIPQKQVKTPAATIATLFPNLDRFAIGWESVLNDLQQATSRKTSYPPYDVVKLEGGIFIINLAVAGFSRKELEILVHGNKLTISGNQDNEVSDEVTEGEFIYNGIAKRDFTLHFRLADGVTLESARLEEGILTVHLKREVPESEKPKTIEIK